LESRLRLDRRREAPCRAGQSLSALFGNDNNKPTRKASGSTLPAIAWHRFMSAALAGLRPELRD
jgi:hypothetical protein